MSKQKKISHKLKSFIILFSLFISSYLTASDAQSQLYLNKVAKLSGFGIGYRIVIQNKYAYITENEGFIIVDIENPLKPTKVGEFLSDYNGFGIFIQNDLAFLASAGFGLEIVNISNPMNPFLVGDCYTGGISSNVYISGKYAYVSNYETGFHIIDITNLSNPIEIGGYSVYDRADNVIVVDNVAFVAFPSQGLIVLNVTIPSSPIYIRTVSFTRGAKGLGIFQNLLFVSCYSSRVIVLDISTQDNPEILGVYSDNDEGEAWGVAGNNTHLYVADYYGVEYLDISSLPTIIEKAENRGKISSVHDIDFVDNYVFIAGGNIGKTCMVFEVSNIQKVNYLWIYIGVPITVLIVAMLIWRISKIIIKRKKS